MVSSVIRASAKSYISAGHGVVQFVEDSAHSMYAVKFFLDHDAFLHEASLYVACFPYIERRIGQGLSQRAGAAKPLAQCAVKFLPQIEEICDGSEGLLHDPRGRVVPPCIVMEKGESLYDWSERATPDLFTSVAVCSSYMTYCGGLRSASKCTCQNMCSILTGGTDCFHTRR